MGPQGGQCLLDLELPGQDPQEGHGGQVLPVDLETKAPHPAVQGAAQGRQEEPEEVQRSVHRQGQDEAQQGQQGARGQATGHDGGVHRLQVSFLLPFMF